MADDTLLEPLKGYNSVYKEKHKQLVEECFNDLVNKSGINVEENKQTVKKYDAKVVEIKTLSKSVGWLTFAKILNIILGVGCIVGLIFVIYAGVKKTIGSPLNVVLPIILGILGIVFLVLAFTTINKKLKTTTENRNQKQKEADILKDEAYNQMAPLNALYDWGISEKIFSKTVPEITMDNFFDSKKYAYLRDNYGYHFQDEENMSTYLCQSGTIAGNPFLLCKDYIQDWRPRLYTGSIVVTYQATETDSEGHTHRVTRTQVLTATISRPEPYYYYDTYLVYGNDAAPNLIFSRSPSGMSGKKESRIDRYVKSRTKSLEKKARTAVKNDSNYTKLGNNQFEALFGGENRNNEVEFRLLFTPLAEKSLIDLIKTPVPFGDDFEFIKHEKINIIHSDHSQKTDYYSNPLRYVSYSYDLAKKEFEEFNEQFFKGLYFDLAPLMSIPLYQHNKSLDYIYDEKKETNVSEYEHESIANSFDQSIFRPENADTPCILKCDFISKSGKSDIVKVRANSFEALKRVTYVPRMAADGVMHLVPVFWIEYEPISSESRMMVEQLDTTRQKFNQIKDSDDFKKSLSVSSLGDYVYERGLFASTIPTSGGSYEFTKFNKSYEDIAKAMTGVMVASEIMHSLEDEMDNQNNREKAKEINKAEAKLNDKNVKYTEKDATIEDKKNVDKKEN